MYIEKDISGRLNEIFEARIGRIISISQEHSKKTSDKRLWARVELFPAGTYDNVPFWGGGFDLNSEMPHGFFCPPRENQLILILFIGGSFANPFAAIPIPHPYDASFTDKYNDLIENVNDISLFHYSGSRIILREDGTIDIQKRIEESTDNFVNHTMKIEFKYESGIRKKIITDVDNDVIIEITTDDLTITDPADQIINMHFKTGEEKINIQDKSGQKLLLDSTTGSENVNLFKSETQKIEQKAASTDIKAPLLNLLGANESFVKGDTLEAQLNVIITALQAFSSGLNPTTLAGQSATLNTAMGVALGILNQIKSTTIKGE